jgi:hypothetical protein
MNSRRYLLAGLLPLLAACGQTRGAIREPVDSRALDGVWTVDFTLESPLAPGHLPRQRTLRGRMALLSDNALAGHPELSGRPTHSGSYATRFLPFGFDLESGAGPPALEARLSAGDSVEIALQPGGAAGVRLRGVLAGDSVAGSWLYDHERGGAASGRFVMRRMAAPHPARN